MASPWGLLLLFEVDPVHAAAEPGQQLIADRSRPVREVIDGRARAHDLDPGPALRKLPRNVRDIDRYQVHRNAADDRDRVIADETHRSWLDGRAAQCPQE